MSDEDVGSPLSNDHEHEVAEENMAESGKMGEEMQ